MFHKRAAELSQTVKKRGLAWASLPPSHPLIHGAGIDRALGEVARQRLALEGVDQTPRPRKVASKGDRRGWRAQLVRGSRRLAA